MSNFNRAELQSASNDLGIFFNNADLKFQLLLEVETKQVVKIACGNCWKQETLTRFS